MEAIKLMWVAAGGACGASLRYMISLIPIKAAFPILTLLTNFMGAFLIGLIVGFAEDQRLSANHTLFWKTGVCGGFTTFSTFSLETLNLLEGGKVQAGFLYILLSVGLCVAGVYIGRSAVLMVRR